jgi:hypothetical protein
MSFLTSFWDSMTYHLAQMLGSMAGSIVQILLYLLVAYLCWGFLWDRILIKAGYKGKAFIWRFGLLFAPALVVPLDRVLSREIYQGLGVTASILFYLGVVILAIVPWNRKPKSEPENTKPENLNRDLINLKHKTGIHFKDTQNK